MVYFIEAVGVSLVKIGFTDGDPETRLKQLQTGCPHPLRLKGAVRGDARRERAFHDQFAHLRESGEWFRLTVELEVFIATALLVLPRLEELDQKVEGFRQWVHDARYKVNRFTLEAEQAHCTAIIVRREVEEWMQDLGYQRRGSDTDRMSPDLGDYLSGEGGYVRRNDDDDSILKGI